jgi:hypothetical protein
MYAIYNKVGRRRGARRAACTALLALGFIVVLAIARNRGADYSLLPRLRASLAGGDSNMAWVMLETEEDLYALWVIACLVHTVRSPQGLNPGLAKEEIARLVTAAVAIGGAAESLYSSEYDRFAPETKAWMPKP